MTLWFTSDHHFGHARIIDYCARPFEDAKSMDRAMIARWNAVVAPEDTVYHLGDFTLSGRKAARRYFAQLQGQIKVLALPWHHDHKWLPEALGPCAELVSASGAPVELLPPMVVLELEEHGEGGHARALVLCHYPVASWDRRHHGAWHLYGHSHGTHANGGKSLDIGVDCTDFAPWSLEQVAARMAQLPMEGGPDDRASDTR